MQLFTNFCTNIVQPNHGLTMTFFIIITMVNIQRFTRLETVAVSLIFKNEVAHSLWGLILVRISWLMMLTMNLYFNRVRVHNYSQDCSLPWWPHETKLVVDWFSLQSWLKLDIFLDHWARSLLELFKVSLNWKLNWKLIKVYSTSWLLYKYWVHD